MTVVTFQADVSKALEQLERYFLTQDDDGHHFVVPVARRDEWEAWRDIPPDDERAWEPPIFARPVGGAPDMVTFAAPEIP